MLTAKDFVGPNYPISNGSLVLGIQAAGIYVVSIPIPSFDELIFIAMRDGLS
jgi:hypothetical protein